MWRHSLESRGYALVREARQRRVAERSLPALIDDEGTVWSSADSSWIAVFQRQPDGEAAALYCLDCARRPDGWQPLGRGWAAYDPALARADAAAAARVKPAPPRRAEPADPRELRY